MAIEVVHQKHCHTCGSKLEGETLERFQKRQGEMELLREQAALTKRFGDPQEGDRTFGRDLTGHFDYTYRQGWWFHTGTGDMVGKTW